MIRGKEKIYFLLGCIKDVRAITPSGKPLKLHPMDDLYGNYRDVELAQLFTKLEKDEKVLKVLQNPNRVRNAILQEYLQYQDMDDGCYNIKLLPAYDDYFLKVQSEPEYQEFTGKTPSKRKSQSVPDLSALHQEIYNKCHSLFEKEEYPEAVEKGFKIVRDRLRDLTGHETGSKAFGNTKLHIKGAVASNVDNDFNEGVKFLMMAIDMFRNEKSHTSDAKIDDTQRAYEYLTLSSLAMNLLDQAETTAT